MAPIANTLDLIDLMGPGATREDYEALSALIQTVLDDPEMWEDES